MQRESVRRLPSFRASWASSLAAALLLALLEGTRVAAQGGSAQLSEWCRYGGHNSTLTSLFNTTCMVGGQRVAGGRRIEPREKNRSPRREVVTPWTQ